jgi:hypothetical protein
MSNVAWFADIEGEQDVVMEAFRKMAEYLDADGSDYYVRLADEFCAPILTYSRNDKEMISS